LGGLQSGVCQFRVQPKIDPMKTEDLLQELSVLMYRAPLSRVRGEPDYPNLANPLHLTILLLDSDTEMEMGGMTGFLEGGAGRHLPKVTEALRMIGASKWAGILRAIQESLAKHGVSREQLQGDPKADRNPDSLDSFKKDLRTMAPDHPLFGEGDDSEDVFGALCRYIEERMDEFGKELHQRRG
jgi:hypothetical protein